ncbi:hypothetical protein IMZ48_25110, partial [Candidatus Bathyarchaeota archaeon]|nr:hypothetical protein [Candidatus Bathyarchaeota archaeon]
PDGDHLTLLNAYHAYKGQQGDPQGDAKSWCHEHFLSMRHLNSADNVRSQLKRIMESRGLELMSTPFEDKDYYTNIRRALLAGFFMQVAKRDNSAKVYHTIKDHQSVKLHPSTVLKTDYDWVVYNEFVLTSHQYIRTCTGIKPEWLLVSCPLHFLYHESQLPPPTVFSPILRREANQKQEIAPNYYDLESFDAGEVKSALMRASDKKRRLESVKRKGGNR